MERIKLGAPGAKKKFEEWIRDRGGIQSWNYPERTSSHGGASYTPRLTEDGVPYPGPFGMRAVGLFLDLEEFEFPISWKEFKRIRVAVRRGAQGLLFKATDHSMAKIHRAEDAAREKYGECYRQKDGGLFDDRREVVILVPVWNEEGKKI